MANVGIYDMTDTWNNAGTAFTAIKMNVTDTASAAGSKLLDVQKGGSSYLELNKSGELGILDKIFHLGDTNTAIRFPSADTVTVETAGSERMRIDSSGNLTLGQVVAGTGSANPVYFTAGSTFANTAGDAAKTKLRVFEDNTGAIYGFGVSGGLFETHVPASAAMAWYINNSERMRITSGGSVGIGTTSPQTRLQVTNSIGTLENKLHTGTFGALNNGQTLVFTLDQAGTYGIELTVVCSNSSTGATAFMQTLHKYVISTAFFLSSANQTIWANGVTAATVAYGGAANTVKISVANSSGTNYDGGAHPFSNTWSLRVFSTANPSVSVSIV